VVRGISKEGSWIEDIGLEKAEEKGLETPTLEWNRNGLRGDRPKEIELGLDLGPIRWWKSQN
jgi:hypothetical protein